MARPSTNWRYFFIAAGLWNVGAGLPLLFAPSKANVLWLSCEAAPVEYNVFVQFSGFIIALLGFGYAAAGWLPDAFASVLCLGVVGKLFAFILFVSYWLQGLAIKPTLPFGGVVDLVFAICFVIFLMQWWKSLPGRSRDG